MAERWVAPDRRAQVSVRLGRPLATVSYGRASATPSVSQHSSRTPSPQSSYVPGQQHGLQNYSKLEAPRLEAVRAGLSSPAASPRPLVSPTASPAASPRRASYHVSQPSSPISPQHGRLSQSAWPVAWGAPPPAVVSRPPPQRRLTSPQAVSPLKCVQGTGGMVRHTLMSKEELQRTLQRCQRTLEADVRRLTKPGQPGPSRTSQAPQTPRGSPVQTPAPPPPEAVPQPQCLTSARAAAPGSSPRSSPGPVELRASPYSPASEPQNGATSPQRMGRLVAPGAALSQVREDSEITMADTTILSQELLEKKEAVSGGCRVPFGDLSNTILTKQAESTHMKEPKKVENIKDDEDISTEDQAVAEGQGGEHVDSLDSSAISALSPRGGSCPSVSSLGLWDPSPQHSECHRPLVTRMTSLPFSDVATPPPRDTLYWPHLDNSATESSFSVHLNMSPLVQRNGSSPAPTPQCQTPCNASWASSRRSAGPSNCHANRGCPQLSGTRRCFEWTSPGLSVSQSSLMSSLLSVSAASLPKVEQEQCRIAKAIGELAQLEGEYLQTQGQLDDLLAAQEAVQELEAGPPGEEASEEPGSRICDESSSFEVNCTALKSAEESLCGDDYISETPSFGGSSAAGTGLAVLESASVRYAAELAERCQRRDCDTVAGPDAGNGQADGRQCRGSSDAKPAYASIAPAASSRTCSQPVDKSSLSAGDDGSGEESQRSATNHLVRLSAPHTSCSHWCWVM
mmetsp:Transcript_126931/g.237320  ORF Transcript_126931/g.237320 Transcript_126931/m.237320 type:complete len:740 (-) Transcript_126931:92-2311(-)